MTLLSNINQTDLKWVSLSLIQKWISEDRTFHEKSFEGAAVIFLRFSRIVLEVSWKRGNFESWRSISNFCLVWQARWILFYTMVRHFKLMLRLKYTQCKLTNSPDTFQMASVWRVIINVAWDGFLLTVNTSIAWMSCFLHKSYRITPTNNGIFYNL